MNKHEAELLSLLAEYSALKAEQTARITLRDTTPYITIAAFGAVISTVFSGSDKSYNILLGIPVFSFCMFILYINNDRIVTKLRVYFNEILRSKVHLCIGKISELEDSCVPAQTFNVESVFFWENYHRSVDSGRSDRKLYHAVSLTVIYLITSIVAVVFSFASATAIGGWAAVLWHVDIVCCVGLAIVIGINVDIY